MRNNEERYRNIMRKVEAAKSKKKKSKSFYWAVGGCAAAAAVVVAVAVPMSLSGSAVPAAVTDDTPMLASMQAEATEKAEESSPQVEIIADAGENKTETADTGFEFYTDYDEIYDAINVMAGDLVPAEGDVEVAMEEAAAEDVMDIESAPEVPAAEAPAEDSAVSSKAESAVGMRPDTGEEDYSKTNVQVEGVDEADIVKTDGKYIYYLCEDRLYIAKAAGEDTEVVSRLKLGGSNGLSYMQEMYLMDGRIVAIGNGYNEFMVKGTPFGEDITYQVIVDISDPENPDIIKTLGQSGSYVSSRAVGGHVFTVTTKYVWNIYEDEIKTFIPAYGEEGDMALMKPEDICVAKNPGESAYTVVTSVDVKTGTMSDKSKAVFGGAGTVYSDGKTLIAAAPSYDSKDFETVRNGKECTVQIGCPNTNIAVYDISGGDVDLKGTAKVKGQLLNQFSMDIHDGYYRFATHESEYTTYVFTEGIDTYEYDNYESNSIYVLNSDLKEVGSITDIAEDEQIQSVRFDGDKVYFVTFIQTDPLFCVDLSDPENPKITSELKLPGFSSYLHVFGEGRLLGFGFDADEETGVTEELKLSMFDSSDSENLKEITTTLVDDCYYSEAAYNHKSLLIDTEKGIIGFPGENDYYLYAYEEGRGFVRLLRVREDDEWGYWNKRGVMIGDSVYVIDGYGIQVIDMSGLKVVKRVEW